MFRRIMFVSVLLLMAPALAMGSTARLQGLGVMPDFVEDYANIFAYPVSVTRYPAVVVGELGYDFGFGKGFGATMGLGEDNSYGVLGIMLREHNSFDPIWGMYGFGDSQFDILWGMNFGNASFGARFDNASSEFEWEDDTDHWKFSPLWLWYFTGPEDLLVSDMNTMGLAFSGAMDVRDGDKVEATFEYRTIDYLIDDITGDWSVEDKGEPSYGFWGRGMFAMAENMTLVPMVGYNKYDYSWEIQSPVPDEEDASDLVLTSMKAGLGLRVDVGSFFMFGLGYSQNKMEIDNSFGEAAPAGGLPETVEFTSTSMPFFFGCFETDIRDWLTVRFGAKKHLLAEEATIEYVNGTKIEFKTKNGNFPVEVRDFFYFGEGVYLPIFDEPFAFSMGLGFKFGDLEIDATLNEDYPFTGMYWLSGESEMPFGKISATYYY